MKKTVQDDLICRYVRNIDETARKILFYSKTSSVYKYENDSWVETGIIGTCVIYIKSNNKKVLCVFNRKKLKDFFLCLGFDTKVEREGDLIIFSNNQSNDIYGVWFCDPEIIKKLLTIFC